jgi:hypothetical protein
VLEGQDEGNVERSGHLSFPQGSLSTGMLAAT